jgi:hypothetical protein
VLAEPQRWNPEWFDCVNAFVDFEKAAGFSSQDNRLPVAKSRPGEFSDWFKIGRKTSGSGWDGFCSGDANSFGKTWKKWWFDIQPNARKRGNTLLKAIELDELDDWGPLRKSGTNGMFLVLVALLWWRARLGDDAEATSLLDWQESVEDVTSVLCCLQNSIAGQDSVEADKSIKPTSGGTKRK